MTTTTKQRAAKKAAKLGVERLQELHAEGRLTDFELASILEAIEDEAADALFDYASTPVEFVTTVLAEHLWSKQQEIIEAVRDHRRVAVQSCHDVGKSFNAARVIAWWVATHEDSFAVTTAPTFQQVRAILWQELAVAHHKGALPGELNQTEWWMMRDGVRKMVGFGRKPADRDPAAFQGIHHEHVLVVIDEACGVPKPLWDAADSLIANEESHILAIGNPDDPTSEFEKACRPDSDFEVIKISAFDSPNLAGEEIPEKVRPLLVSETWVNEKKKRWGESSPLYQSKVLGVFPAAGDDVLVPLSWALAAAERDRVAELEAYPEFVKAIESGEVILERTLSCDVARFGADRTVIGERVNNVYGTREEYAKQDTMVTAGHCVRALRETKSLGITVDVVGVGGGVVDRLAEQNLPVFGLNAGAASSDPSQYGNLRAEAYWYLRMLFEETAREVEASRIEGREPQPWLGLFITDTDGVLVSEMSTLHYKIDSRGRIWIEKKDDIKARGLPSPDHADAMMLAYAEPVIETEGVATYSAHQQISRY